MLGSRGFRELNDSLTPFGFPQPGWTGDAYRRPALYRGMAQLSSPRADCGEFYQARRRYLRALHAQRLRHL